MNDPISVDYVRELEAQMVCLAEAARHAAALLEQNEPALDIHQIKTGRDGRAEVAQMRAPATARRFAARYREMEAVTAAARAYIVADTAETRAALQAALDRHDKAERRRMKKIQAVSRKEGPWWEVEP